ncbi:MAG: glycoside hydrolase family 3 protein [Clostridiales bacterium]|nr:glycoside hydrolase family 3 protein [Clostridiales bacterium]
MKKTIACILALLMLPAASACQAKQSQDAAGVSGSDAQSEVSSSEVSETSETVPADETEESVTYKYQRYADMTPEEIVAEMTLKEKAAQMVQPIYYMTDAEDIRKDDYGSIYLDENMFTAEEWREVADEFQQAAIDSESGIPLLLAEDDVHGVGYCVNGVYFPQNIGIGAANDEDLAYQMGRITADEAKLCHMIWNLYPCVAQSNDPRWGRNYECYSSDLDTITRLSTAYTRGLIDGGLVACAKHYFGDGNVVYGTGEHSDFDRLIDRGDAQLSQEEIEKLIAVYQAQIDAGVQTIMVSYSSLNGLKMHENGEYIRKLKDEMGFTGFVVSDSMAIQNTSPEKYEDQVISAINCGIDMLMEGMRFEDARMIIMGAVNTGKISQERIDEAVTRIIKVKKEAGVFEDPFFEHADTVQQETGSMEYRAVAEELVEKSLVLVKNDNGTLPLKEGTKVYVTGPAAHNPRAQCGGWTMGWNQSPTKDIVGVTTIKEAFERYACDYGIEVITDPEKTSEADVILLCIGEDAYAEWYGDSEDLALCGKTGLMGNREAIDTVKEYGKPTVTCIIAGRHLIIDEADYDAWDSVVMCYLPGSEGKGISDVLCGCSDFTGRLPEPWYGSVEKIGGDEVLFERGYGLSYPDGFTAKTEPVAIPDPPSEEDLEDHFDVIDPMAGTNYSKGVFKDGVYTSDYAGLTLSIPDELKGDTPKELEMQKEMNLESCTTEKDLNLEMATHIENNFYAYDMGNSRALSVSVMFLNTKLAAPDDPDYTEEKYLDDYAEYFTASVAFVGINTNYESREKVILGGVKYTKDTCKVSGYGANQYVYRYARRIDDQVMCIVSIEGLDQPDSLFT